MLFRDVLRHVDHNSFQQRSLLVENLDAVAVGQPAKWNL
jgi:hypothetical protein